MEWDVTLETGNEAVDGQHRALLAMFNELEATELEHGPDEVRSVLEGLTDYVSVHFAMEEDLMRTRAYPARRDRRARRGAPRPDRAHARHGPRLPVGDLGSIAPLTDLLTGWLIHHVIEMDQVLVAHVTRAADRGGTLSGIARSRRGRGRSRRPARRRPPSSRGCRRCHARRSSATTTPRRGNSSIASIASGRQSRSSRFRDQLAPSRRAAPLKAVHHPLLDAAAHRSDVHAHASLRLLPGRRLLQPDAITLGIEDERDDADHRAHVARLLEHLPPAARRAASMPAMSPIVLR